MSAGAFGYRIWAGIDVGAGDGTGKRADPAAWGWDAVAAHALLGARFTRLGPRASLAFAQRFDAGAGGRLGRRAEAGRILRFLVVGLVTFGIYTATLAVAIEWFGASTVAGTAAAFVVGTAVSLVGNSVFVFRTAISAQTSGKFVVVTLFGFAANLLLSWWLDRLGVHYVVIAFAIFAIVPAMNYASSPAVDVRASIREGHGGRGWAELHPS